MDFVNNFIGYLEVDDISVDLIERCFYTSVYNNNGNSSSQCSYPDLLVRTSGESRLSDFLLWQSSYSVTHFTNVLWPDFGFNHLMAAIFHYQSKKYYISEILNSSSVMKDGPTSLLTDNPASSLNDDFEEQKRRRIARFLELLDNSKFCCVKKDSQSEPKFTQDDSRIIESIDTMDNNKGL